MALVSILCRLVALKVLNSIVLLGKSCVYVKRAHMEDKLFERPSNSSSWSSSGKSPSRAEKTKGPPPSGKPMASLLTFVSSGNMRYI